MQGVLDACCSTCTAARTFHDSDLGAQEYAPGGDMYGVLAAAGGFLHEEQVAGGVLLPLLRALAALHGQARLPCSAGCRSPSACPLQWACADCQPLRGAVGQETVPL